MIRHHVTGEEAEMSYFSKTETVRDKIAGAFRAMLGPFTLQTVFPFMTDGAPPTRALSRSLLAGLTSLVFGWGATWLPADDEDAGHAFYRETVFPLLEANCFECHGGGDRLKGDFRITSRAGLMRGGHFGPGVNEDDPSESVLLRMVSYEDEDYQMPPKGKLADADLAILREWVERGAPYDPELEIEGEPGEAAGMVVTDEDRDYWAYRDLSAPVPPDVDDADWEQNPVDRFILARLEEAGLEPNGPATPRQLVRRVFYDLTGLPPSPKEIDSWEAALETDPGQAWRSLIEDLLARPQYGEKWARHWLDLVRYAETNGFERDNPKPHIWRYRDYVIDAFNRDTPYDRFIIEQLAGDEIAKPTEASYAATGFHRLMQWDDEPADRKQHVYDVLADNVLVTGETFLATTLGCARCHDHKADPISQKDYYSFMAYFHGITPYRTEGTLLSWAADAEKVAFEKRREERVSAERKKSAALEAEMLTWIEGSGGAGEAGRDGPEAVVYVDDARGEPASWFFTTSRPAPGWKEVGERVKNWTRAPGGFGKKGTPNARIGATWDTEAIWMRTTFGATAIPETLVLEIHHDEDVEVYLNGHRIYVATGYTRDYETVKLGRAALDAFQTGRNVLAIHCRQTAGGQFIDASLRTGTTRNDSIAELIRRGGKKLERDLQEGTGRNIVKEWRDTQAKIVAIRKELPGTPINAVTEVAEPGPMHVHLRGSAHAPGDPVSPAVPVVMTGPDDGQPGIVPVERYGFRSSGRRLALAQWIAHPENPLTARVMVNRIWQHHFGRGIVPSTSDFGKLGEDPTHPELLDFLAASFVEGGWSIKDLHRLILTSRAYRMSSAPDSANLVQDPSNKLFWRFDMRRLTAEEIRDSILALSGSLNLERGGPWVYPPLPTEVLATASRPGKGWPVSKDESDHFRRSVYVHVKRSLRHQMLADFDQAPTDSPCAVRFATTVPTQALTMLNSAFVNEQAVAFAERLSQGGAVTAREKVTRGLELTLQRSPTPEEIAECLELIDRLRSEHGLDDQAALQRFALLALNLNEFVYLD